MVFEKPNDYKKEIVIINSLLNGYLCFYDKEHPLSYKKNGLVYLHRHNASVKYGRWLLKDEHVHHIDENKFNNNFENLSVMTQNEHVRLHNKKEIITKPCLNCNEVFEVKKESQICCSNRCKTVQRRKAVRPSKEELEKLIWQESTQKLAKKFGVSDKAIEKWCKSYGIKKPPRGYWAKVYAKCTEV